MDWNKSGEGVEHSVEKQNEKYRTRIKAQIGNMSQKV